MQYTIHHRGVPLGRVDLEANALVSAGTLSPMPAYASVQPTIRAGSIALEHLSFLGAATSGPSGQDGTPPSPAENVVPLRAAAALQFDLVTDDGHLVPTTFLNLIEPAGDDRVFVLARFRDAGMRETAKVPTPSRQDDSSSGLPDERGV